MRRSLCVALVVIVATVLAFAAKPPSPLQQKLDNEFLRRSFTTKILVGGYVETRNPNCPACQYRLVDTEVTPDGNVQYFMRRGYFGILLSTEPGGYVTSGRLTGKFPAGSQLLVTNIELKDDRIEFQLNRRQGGLAVQDFAKIKFMFGTGYKSWEYDRIEQLISQSLRIERLEQFAMLDSEYKALTTQLATAKSAYDSVPVSDYPAKIAAAQQLQSIYQRLAKNRSAISSLLGHASDEGAAFEKQAADLDPEIKKLQEAAKSQRCAAQAGLTTPLKQQYLSVRSQLATKPPTSKKQLQQRQDDIKRANDLLGQVRANYAQQQSSGCQVQPSELEWLDSQSKQLEGLTASLSGAEGSIELHDLETQYHAMEAKRDELQAAYMKAAGTPEQSRAATALKGQLQLMYDNRMAASRMGNKHATAQANGLKLAIDHLN